MKQWQKGILLKERLLARFKHLAGREIWVQATAPASIVADSDQGQGQGRVVVVADNAYYSNLLHGNQVVIVPSKGIELVSEFSDSPPRIQWQEFAKKERRR